MADELEDVLLSKRIGWTYQQLKSQPQRFIDILKVMASVDLQVDKIKLERAKLAAEKNKGGSP